MKISKKELVKTVAIQGKIINSLRKKLAWRTTQRDDRCEEYNELEKYWNKVQCEGVAEFKRLQNRIDELEKSICNGAKI